MERDCESAIGTKQGHECEKMCVQIKAFCFTWLDASVS